MLVSRGKYKKAAYEQAISFRRRGFTYSEIAKICDVSRGTVSNWLSKEPFSVSVTIENKVRAAKDNVARIKLVNKSRSAERATQYSEILRLAETEYRHYSKDQLFITGLMLYLAEGDRNNLRIIRISNTNIDIHRIFTRFVRDYLGVEKQNIHFWLLLYPDQDEVKCMKHWINKTGISASQFYKNQFIKSRSNKSALHFGVGNTIIGSTLLKKKLLLWIELALKKLNDK
jgi:transcriptional regulator with XRE-family HTH domain